MNDLAGFVYGFGAVTFPFPLRFLLAAQPKALTEVLAVVQRGISTFLVRRAGFTVASGARTGAVTLIQRFGAALNLNIHRHMLFLDGAYSFSQRGASFHRARRPTNDELTTLLDTLSRRIVWVLERLCRYITRPPVAAGASRRSIQQGLRCRVNWPREWFGCASGGAPLPAAGAAFSGLCDADDGSSGVAWAKTGVRLQPQILA